MFLSGFLFFLLFLQSFQFSVHLPFCISAHHLLFLYLSACLSICVPIFPFIYLPIYPDPSLPTNYISVYFSRLQLFMNICPSIFLATFLPIWPSIYLPTLSNYLGVHASGRDLQVYRCVK